MALTPMLSGIVCLTGVLAGGTIACLARRHPRHRNLLETTGGILLIAGFAVLGFSLGLAFCLSCSSGQALRRSERLGGVFSPELSPQRKVFAALCF
jgi:hypothetical protein